MFLVVVAVVRKDGRSCRVSDEVEDLMVRRDLGDVEYK